jgi:hypothetical protein
MLDLELHQIDVVSIYLAGDLEEKEEKIYIKISKKIETRARSITLI